MNTHFPAIFQIIISTMASATTVKKRKDGSGQMKYRKQRKYLEKMKKKDKDILLP